jgi:hypothetical protein
LIKAAFDMGTVAPVLVLAGVVVFRATDSGRAKNLGRSQSGLG